MSQPTIEPHKIQTPINLLAVWFVALVLLVGAFFTAASQLENPKWLPGFLVIAGVALVPFFGILIYRLQTTHRSKLLEGDQYLKYLDREFENFTPENLQPDTGESSPKGETEGTPETLEELRKQIYDDNHRIFLVHNWRPSEKKGQVADITIQLHQHWKGLLSEGKVKSVEYQLGRKFFDHPIVKTDPSNKFRLDVSAYGPMLCVAKVYFLDGTDPIVLTRYINFSVLPSEK